jgi:hypothetical protein
VQEAQEVHLFLVPIMGQRGWATPWAFWMVSSSFRASDFCLTMVTNSRTFPMAPSRIGSDLMTSSIYKN